MTTWKRSLSGDERRSSLKEEDDEESEDKEKPGLNR